MGNVVHRVNVSLGERGDRLTRAEDKTVELLHKTQQFADTTHKVTSPIASVTDNTNEQADQFRSLICVSLLPAGPEVR